jgi:hypothetical protein
MTRLCIALLGIVLVACGCGVGPIKNRLYVEEWKSKKRHPIPIERNWVYEGEHWEHAVYVDAGGD